MNTIHPLAEYRHSIHYSQDDLANVCGITRQIITNTEAGIYSEIPPSILKGLREELGATPKEIDALAEAHRQWIIDELAALNISPLIDEHGDHFFPVGIGSFTQWRELLSDSIAGFAKLMKLQPITIKKYETGQTNNLPQQLVDRLLGFGFHIEYINRIALLPIKGPTNAKRKGIR